VNDVHTQSALDPELSPEALTERFGFDVVRDFDLEKPEFNDNFQEVMDFVVQKCPVLHSTTGKGYTVFNTEEAVRKAGQDWQTFSSAKGYMHNRPDDLPYLIPVEQDPPNHSSWRQKLNPFMTIKVMESKAELMRADANLLIDRFIDRGNCEFVSEFAGIMPGWAFFKHNLGVPVDELDMLVHNVEMGLYAEMDERPGYFAKVFEYLDGFLKKRKEMPPQGDIVDAILEGVTYGDGTPAPWDHQLSVAADLTFGGISTTIYAMGSSLYHLIKHPADLQLLLDRPDLIENAVEEFIRAYSPVVAMGRSCTRDVTLTGVDLKEGDFIMLGFAGASRDPRAIENPRVLNFEQPTIQHSTFGVGPHRCIGAHLARVELRIFLEEWLRRIPSFRLKPGTEPSYGTSFMRAMNSMYLEW
jgi:cytochrome P450